MDLPFPWTFVLFTLCFVALIAGALLGFAVGFRTGGRQERFRLVKEKLKRNKAAICRWQKERYEYARQVKQLEEDLLHSASESEHYKERMSDLEFYQQKLRESERIISSLSVENECQSDSLSMLVQLKEDPLRTNLTREEEWAVPSDRYPFHPCLVRLEGEAEGLPAMNRKSAVWSNGTSRGRNNWLFSIILRKH